MEKITRSELIKLGGAPDARFAVFHKDGELYFCATVSTKHDESFWKEKGYTMKEVTE